MARRSYEEFVLRPVGGPEGRRTEGSDSKVVVAIGRPLGSRRAGMALRTPCRSRPTPPTTCWRRLAQRRLTGVPRPAAEAAARRAECRLARLQNQPEGLICAGRAAAGSNA